MSRIIVRNERDAEMGFNLIQSATVVGCDTETSSLDSRTGRLYSIQFSDGETDILIPISEGSKIYGFKDILKNPSVVKVFHNAKFDLGFLAAYGLSVQNVFCSMIAEKVLTRGANQSASLADTLYRHFGIDLDKGKRSVFTSKWDGQWTEDLVDYALSDVRFLPRLMKEQRDWMGRLTLESAYREALRKAGLTD